MSDKDSESGGDVEVIEVKAANSLVPNLTISVDKDGEEPTVEFHEEEKMATNEENENGKSGDSGVEFKVEAKAFSHTKIYENKILKEMGFTAEEARLRKQNRAKRFLSPMLRDKEDAENPDQIPVEDLLEQVKEYNKEIDMFKEIRLDAIHLQGLDDMSTDEIFKFFDDHYPSHIEWINDSSCNVVWKDQKSAATAILSMSDPIKPRSKSTEAKSQGSQEEKSDEMKKEEDDDLDLMDSEDEEKMDTDETENPANVDTSQRKPFTNELRLCKNPVVKNDKKTLLKMRFADLSDKKTVGGAKKSQYYRKYGNPNYGNVKGILSRSFKKRYHGRAAKQEYEEYKPEDVKQNSNKKAATKRLYSEQAWVDAKKARKEQDDESSSSSDEEDKLQREDEELINSSAKDLEGAIPVEKDEDKSHSSLTADAVLRGTEAERRIEKEAARNGTLNIKVGNSGSVWQRLGKRNKGSLAVTVDNRPSDSRRDRPSDRDDVRNRLPKSLRDRLGTKRR